jgi:hypothetical protein
MFESAGLSTRPHISHSDAAALEHRVETLSFGNSYLPSWVSDLRPQRVVWTSMLSEQGLCTESFEKSICPLHPQILEIRGARLGRVKSHVEASIEQYPHFLCGPFLELITSKLPGWLDEILTEDLGSHVKVALTMAQTHSFHEVIDGPLGRQVIGSPEKDGSDLNGIMIKAWLAYEKVLLSPDGVLRYAMAELGDNISLLPLEMLPESGKLALLVHQYLWKLLCVYKHTFFLTDSGFIGIGPRGIKDTCDGLILVEGVYLPQIVRYVKQRDQNLVIGAACVLELLGDQIRCERLRGMTEWDFMDSTEMNYDTARYKNIIELV